MLELVLMDDLEEEQRELAVSIVFEELAKSGFEPDPYTQFGDLGKVVIAALIDDQAVAVYELPYFVLEEGVLKNKDSGYLVVKSKVRGQGIGTKVVKVLGTIFESLGYATGASVEHTEGVEKIGDESTLEVERKAAPYKRNGYEHQGLGKAPGWQAHQVYQRTYTQQDHELGVSQKRIIEAFREMI